MNTEDPYAPISYRRAEPTTEPEPGPVDFGALLGPEPAWLVCPCGALSARTPCWDCCRRAETQTAADERRNAALATIPARYAWAALGASELPGRVSAREPLEKLATRVLGAARVVFSGPSGSGKTSFAIACLRERIPYGIFVSAIRLGTARIQGRAGDGEAALVERAMTAPLLLLDEVGGETKTATNAVKDVIFARMDADLPTWITTGFGRDELLAMYGDGCLRRLTEDVTVLRFGAVRP